MSKNKEDMLGVTFDNTDKSFPYIDSDNSLFYIPFYKDIEYFDNYENKIKFVKGVESLVRKHAFYKKYKDYLINVVGMNTCQVLSNITTDDNVTIEMHHGPMLTLFDVCMIVTNYLIRTGCDRITTMYVANIVIEEHRLNNVRVVLLCKSVHQKIDDDDIILNYNQGFGDTNAFLEKYKAGVDKSMRHNINAYIKWSMENDSSDNDVFKIAETLKSWGNNDYEDLENL